MGARQRICLKCNRPFSSMSPANRICPDCQRLNDRLMLTNSRHMAKLRGKKHWNGEKLE